LHDERCGRDLRVERFGSSRERAGSTGDVLDRGGVIDRHEHVHTFGAAGLDRAR
jgi:hypothetical protein